MAVKGALPVARVWTMSGGDVGRPGVAETFCAEIMPPLEALPGYLGAFVFRDEERSLMRGISFWDTRQDLMSSWDFVAWVADATVGLESVELGGPSAYDVFHSDFPVVPGRAQVSAVDEPAARVVAIEGGTITDPSTLGIVRTFLEVMVPMPGCVGALLLTDPTVPRLLSMTFWADRQFAERTTQLAADAVAAVVTASGATAHDVGSYDVLVIQPMAPLRH